MSSGSHGSSRWTSHLDKEIGHVSEASSPSAGYHFANKDNSTLMLLSVGIDKASQTEISGVAAGIPRVHAKSSSAV